jgi:hypothetical protein
MAGGIWGWLSGALGLGQWRERVGWLRAVGSQQQTGRSDNSHLGVQSKSMEKNCKSQTHIFSFTSAFNLIN